MYKCARDILIDIRDGCALGRGSQFGFSKRFPDKENLAETGSGFSATANNSFNNVLALPSANERAIPALFAHV
jgi:hypothetical protein